MNELICIQARCVGITVEKVLPLHKNMALQAIVLLPPPSSLSPPLLPPLPSSPSSPSLSPPKMNEAQTIVFFTTVTLKSLLKSDIKSVSPELSGTDLGSNG